MTAYLSDPETWQESWDRQQESFLPDREHRIAAMLDAVDAATGGASPRLLDLAGGTGTLTLRALVRFPGTEATVLDQDPVLQAIATASLRDRARVVTADLNRPRWTDVLPHRAFDAVLTSTALHWLAAERITALYAELRDVLRPGGVFVNADRMPDDALPGFTERLTARSRERRTARWAAGAAPSWTEWWERAGAHEALRPLMAERARIYPSETHSAEWLPPASWHVAALRAAGFTEAGVLWRGGADAAVIAVR